MSDRKTLEIKRKIIIQARNREYPAAIKLFHKYFSNDNPADVEFINSFFLELNRLNLFEEGYQLMVDTTPWHLGDSDHETLKENAGKLCVDHLNLRGNNLLFEREKKSSQLEESLLRSDPFSREKMREENEKILIGVTLKAKAAFDKAREIIPGNLTALNGLKQCFKQLRDPEKLAEIEAEIAEKNPTLHRAELANQLKSEESDENTPATFVPGEADIEESNLNEIKQLLAQKKYEDLIKRVDFLHFAHRISVPLLLLKIKALAELRRFKEVDAAIFECERQNRNFEEIKDAKSDINELKYRILVKASDIYLKKGVSLGPSMGLSHFKHARTSIQRALSLNPESLDLLDQLYTTLRYLGEQEEAFKIKAAIYNLNPRFVPTFDAGSSSSLCFIASFAYAGQPQKINEFRWFRREFLLSSKFGRYLNSVYVRISPKIIVRTESYRLARPFFRMILSLPLFFVRTLKCLIKLKRSQK